MSNKCENCRFKNDNTNECIAIASEFFANYIKDIPEDGCNQFFSINHDDNVRVKDADTKDIFC